MLKKITQSPYLNLLSGSVLVIAAGNEIWDSFGEVGLAAHHGVALYGLIQILKSLPDIMEGINFVEEAEDS